MRHKSLFIILIFILFLLLQSCEDNFNPYGQFEKKYSLNCIIRGDTSLQVITVFESSSPNENMLEPNINEHFVNDAFIRLWSGNDEIYYLRDTAVTNSSSNEINKFYYTNILKPKNNAQLEIDALLPDGNRLKSKTIIPNKVKPDVERTTDIISSDIGDIVTFAWLSDNVYQIYIPTLSLYYKEKTQNGIKIKTINIPWKYQNENGKEVAIDKPPSKSQQVEYSLKNIEKVLIQLGKNVNKENITILSIILELKIFDKNLSTYYLSSGRLFNDYSVRLDEKDFSNISGGYGIFGSFIVQQMAILFSDEYLITLGYKL